MTDVPSALTERLANARHVAILTGAGISAESGIPTFRDPDGIWEKFDPQELANVEAFLNNPELVQGWYRHRRQLVEETEPNDAHRALVDLEDYVDRVTVITQNVDDLHNRAGSTDVIELHGNLTHNYCSECGEDASPEVVDEAIQDGEPATCSDCGGLIRPDVVWFGEMLPQDAISKAHDVAADADVFFSIGTSAVVYPAARLPGLAKEQGAFVVEVNTDPTAITDEMDVFLEGKAGTIVPAIVNALATA